MALRPLLREFGKASARLALPNYSDAIVVGGISAAQTTYTYTASEDGYLQVWAFVEGSNTHFDADVRIGDSIFQVDPSAYGTYVRGVFPLAKGNTATVVLYPNGATVQDGGLIFFPCLLSG